MLTQSRNTINQAFVCKNSLFSFGNQKKYFVMILLIVLKITEKWYYLIMKIIEE